MKLLLIQNITFKSFISQYPFEATLEFTLIRREHEEKVLQNLEFDLLLSQIENFDGKIDGLVLSNWLTSKTESPKEIFHSAFELATYIRLSNKSVRHLPIAILSNLLIPEILYYGSDIPHILFATYGTKIVAPDQMDWIVKPREDDFSFVDKPSETSQNLSQIFDKDSSDISKVYHSKIREKIKIHERASSGHDIANQWGAYRMAQVVGINHNIKHPKTLYFHFLLSKKEIENTKPKFELKDCDPFHKKPISILYIDDSHSDGWLDCLNDVFLNKIMVDGNDNLSMVSNTSLDDDEIDKIAEDRTYDLILLDYYLLNNEKGIDKLRDIKKANPAIPVIMFTASNKAWNMDDLYEAGADGYYVKEHPETAHDPEFSVKNFENFHKTVKNCLEKGELLRKYWQKIRDIEKSEAIKNKTDVNGHVQMNRERIHERLIMFLGLLKKAYEQTKFDRSTFFYSDWELAFLTLWSTLNEIQEVCYDKNNKFIPFTYIDSTGNSQVISTHPGRSPSIPTHLFNWQIRDSDEFLIVYRPQIDNDGHPIRMNNSFYRLEKCSKIQLDNSISGFKVDLEYSKLDEKRKYEDNLFMQTAFLLDKLYPGNTMNRDYLKKNILRLNNHVRNKLYLTHGEDSSSQNFYEEYKKGRKTDIVWKKHIEELFEIVYFLCTGKDCDWSI